jgi:MFS superfamily sulfate permease-like transporter
LSRSRFMPLTAPHAPLRREARSAPAPAPTVAGPGVAGPDTRIDRRTGVRAKTATAEILCLGLSISLETGPIHRLADTICDRVLGSARPVGTVILDLRAGADIDADSRAALLSLHRRLASMGTRLRIATACRQLAARLREDDLPRHLGADAIHDSVRSAVLATYAALPGPGLVTAHVRAALDIPVEAVDSS